MHKTTLDRLAPGAHFRDCNGDAWEFSRWLRGTPSSAAVVARNIGDGREDLFAACAEVVPLIAQKERDEN